MKRRTSQAIPGLSAAALLFAAVAGCMATNQDAQDPSSNPETSTSFTGTTGASTSSVSTSSNATSGSELPVRWQLAADGSWVPSAPPPDCPEPLVFATPVDLGQATSILYPGQPRGNAFKPHGGFRFDGRADNNVTVTVPFDAWLVRGAHGFRNGTDISSTVGQEEQDGFEFMAPCGIMYSFGHMRHLAPRFQAIADSLPAVYGFSQRQFFDVDPPIHVEVGEVLATGVGLEANRNVFVEMGVLDLRHENGAVLRPEWSQYQAEFDHYPICWLDLLPPDDAAQARALPGGDATSGKESDYC